MEQELVKAEVLAQEWGTTTGALAQMRYLGRGPRFIKISNKAVRYRRSDIDAWLDSQTRQQTGARGAA